MTLNQFRKMFPDEGACRRVFAAKAAPTKMVNSYM
jgi:hypothetical protein